MVAYGPGRFLCIIVSFLMLLNTFAVNVRADDPSRKATTAKRDFLRHVQALFAAALSAILHFAQKAALIPQANGMEIRQFLFPAADGLVRWVKRPVCLPTKRVR